MYLHWDLKVGPYKEIKGAISVGPYMLTNAASAGRQKNEFQLHRSQ